MAIFLRSVAAVSQPRPVIPGKTYLVTRRCIRREFHLCPSGEVNDILLYALGYAAQRYGVAIHAFCAMSNHYHLHLTDLLGNLPEFMQWFNSTVARAVNAFHGDFDSLWSSDKYSRVELAEAGDAFDKLVYVYTNPVSAGLVSRHTEWPGVLTRPCLKGAYALEARRPQKFFREANLPDSVVLHIVPPPLLSGMAGRELGRQLFQAIKEKERAVQRSFDMEGRKFVGARNVLRQTSRQVPKSWERRWKLSPRLACLDKWRRIELLAVAEEWFQRYRVALQRWRSGEREVLFPFGTWWWCRFGGARAEPG